MAWLTGIVGGVLGAALTGLVIQLGFDETILTDGIPSAVGASGMAAGWGVLLAIGAVLGLVYAGLAHVDALRGYARVPGTGAQMGVVFGLVIWALAAVVVPLAGVGDGTELGEYAVNARGILSFVLLGLVLGIVYGASPYTR